MFWLRTLVLSLAASTATHANENVPVEEGNPVTSFPDRPGIIRLNNGQSYWIASGPETPAQKAAVSSLSPERLDLFLKMRENILTGLARALNSSNLALGTGAVVGDKFMLTKDHVIGQIKRVLPNGRSETVQTDNPIEAMAVIEESAQNTNPSRKMSRREFIERMGKAPGKYVTGTLSPRGQAIAQKIIHAIDRELLENADIVVDSHEFGCSVTLGVVGEHGADSKVFGGLKGLTIRTGYDSFNKAVVLALEFRNEKLIRAITPVVTYGVQPTAFVYASSRYESIRQGRSFYPPGIPMGEFHGDGLFEGGYSASDFTGPGGPLANIASYEHNTEIVTVARLEASPKFPFIAARTHGATYFKEKGQAFLSGCAQRLRSILGRR